MDSGHATPAPERLDGPIAGTRFRVRWRTRTGSTNADLLEAARAGEPEGLVLVADHQHRGRGRRDRTWEAPPGSSLLTSVLLRPAVGPDRWHLLATAVGVAASAAVGSVAGVEARLKWPNDLVVGDLKLGGILAESVVGERPAVVVGLGLNVAWGGRRPAHLAGTATALDDHGAPPSRAVLLSALLTELDGLVDVGTTAPGLLERARVLMSTIGRDVVVERDRDRVEGRAVGLADDGGLVVETARGPVTVSVGDVVHLRPV